MGIGFVLTLLGLVIFAVVYSAFRLLCYLKKRYCDAETLVCRVLGYLMCESCRESCSDYRRLLVRAVIVTVAILTALVIGYCLHR